MINNQNNIHNAKMKTEEIYVSNDNFKKIKQKFISLNVISIDIDRDDSRIIEIGAQVFRNGEPKEKFFSQINPGASIPVNVVKNKKITNENLQKAPLEKEVISNFVKFIKKQMGDNVIMCAHRASQHFDELREVLEYNDIDINIQYIDTLRLSKQCIKGLDNYKLETIEKHLGLENIYSNWTENAAYNCGKVLSYILSSDIDYEKNKPRKRIVAKKIDYRGYCRGEKDYKKYYPYEEDYDICAYITKLISSSNIDTKWLSFSRKHSELSANCHSTFLRIGYNKKGRFVIINDKYCKKINLPMEKCSASEGPGCNRVYFSNPFQLAPISTYILESYNRALIELKKYLIMLMIFGYIIGI